MNKHETTEIIESIQGINYMNYVGKSDSYFSDYEIRTLSGVTLVLKKDFVVNVKVGDKIKITTVLI